MALLSASALQLAMIGALLFRALYYDELYACEQLSWRPGGMNRLYFRMGDLLPTITGEFTARSLSFEVKASR